MTFFDSFRGMFIADPDVRHYRMSVCEGCELFTSKRRCSECGCYMDIKTKIGSAVCPKGKW